MKWGRSSALRFLRQLRFSGSWGTQLKPLETKKVGIGLEGLELGSSDGTDVTFSTSADAYADVGVSTSADADVCHILNKNKTF